MVAYICNPSYAGGGGRKDCGLRPAWEKKLAQPNLEQ
jgi:hypothetical protein